MRTLRQSFLVLVLTITLVYIPMGYGKVWGQAKKNYGRSCVDNSCAAGYDLSDVTGMSDGDTAYIPADPTYGGPLSYKWDEDSGLAESLPNVKDADIAGDGRWILQVKPLQAGGTNATSASAARTSLGVPAIAHGDTHLSGGAAEISCNEGLNAQGSSGNKLECSATVPNLAIGCSTTTLSATLTMSCSHMIAGINGGATIAQHKMVYLKTTDQELYETDADTAAGPLGPAVGITTAACTNGAECIICVIGCIRNDAGFDWGAGAAEIGDPIYLSGTVGAGLQALMGTSGDMHQRVGFGVTADIAYFNFTYPYHIVD